MYMLIILLVAALFILVGLTLVLDRRIARHLGKRQSGWIFLFVAVIALYYLLDALLTTGLRMHNPFILFWLAVLLIEALSFVRSRCVRAKKRQEKANA